MSSEHDNTRQEESAMFRRLETLAFFLAMMLAVILDGACAYWMWKHVDSVSATTLDPLREQEGFALPEGWLLAALVVLICRTVETLCTVKSWSHGEVPQNQRAFLCLWGWAMALLIALGVAIHLGPVAP
jgi:ABC-type multidrug transport system fused ATPase/permease subunit